MKHIENFIVERLKLNNDSKINNIKLNDKDIPKVEKILNEFRKLQKTAEEYRHKHKYFQEIDFWWVNWKALTVNDFKRITSEEVKRIFYARSIKDKNSRENYIIIYKNTDGEFKYGSWQQRLFKIDSFNDKGPDDLSSYGPTFNNSIKQKYEFVKNRQAYIAKLPFRNIGDT